MARDALTADTAPFSPVRARRLEALQETHFWFRGRRRLAHAMLRDELRRPRRVLDVGCGAGGTVRWLLERGHHVSGVDASPDSLAYAAQLVPAGALHLGDAAALPFADDSFDGVLLLDVLEHVDDAAAVAEARRVVRPGGWMLVSVPAFQWLWSFRDVDAGHLRRYSRRGLEHLIQRADLAVEHLTYYQCALFPALAAARLAFPGRRERDAEERVPGPLNALLALVHGLEARAAARVGLPWGSSLVLRARVPA